MNPYWPESQLGEEIRLLYGKSLPDTERKSGDVPVYGSNGRVGWHNEPLVTGPGIIVGRKGSVGAIAFADRAYWPIDTTYFVENKRGHDWKFLYYLLKHLRLETMNGHAVVPGLNRETALSLSIRLPEIPEQRAVARILLSVERTLDVELRASECTRDVKLTTMERLFSREWQGHRLGALAKVGNGSTPKRTRLDYWRGGTLPWLTSGKIHERIITAADELVTPIAATECHLPRVPAGSLLVAITGQGKTLGNVALTKIDTFVSQHLAYVTIERDDVDPNFVRHYLSSRYEDLRAIGQAGGSTKGAITCAALKMVPVPVPPIKEQREIARTLDAIDRKIALHERKRATLAELFDTLLHDLMTGRLRVRDLASA